MKPRRLGGARAGRPTTEANGRSHPSEPRKMAARLPLRAQLPESGAGTLAPFPGRRREERAGRLCREHDWGVAEG